MKKTQFSDQLSIFDALPEETLFAILEYLDENPSDKKTFSLLSKSFYAVESRHRKTLKPLRSDLILPILARYNSITRIDLTLCPRITDETLAAISLVCRSNLLSVDLSRSGFFTHIGIGDLVSNCLNLVEIDLSNGTILTDRAAEAISKASNLEKLWLVRCRLISDLGIGCIAVGCRKLKFINLKWCLGISDLGVELVAVKCKEIRSLDLSFVQITNKCLSSILGLQHLEDLILVGCNGIDDDGLRTLNQGCKSLETLNVSNCHNVSQHGLSLLTKRALCLRQLIFAHCYQVTPALAESLQKLPNLETIKLDGSHITGAVLKAIENWCISGLKELSLSKCVGVTDEGLSCLVTKHKKLRKIDITCCAKITHISIASIATSCMSLSSLRMESCCLVSKKAFTLIGQHCRFLEELDLTCCEIDDKGLESISRLLELSSLKVGICLNITDEGLIHVGMRCSKLKELDLYRSVGITDSGISAIARGCPRLQMINLAYCTAITDDSLQSLSKCSMLNTLEIRGCPQITSVGLTYISVGCKQIAKLDIKKCYSINDSGMLPLSRLSKNLRQINLSYCSVTDVGLLALASISCLQNMTILHLRGLTANGLAATLLACGGLTKVKLHTSFKSLLPQPFIEHIEAQGCIFQWRNKPFQVELEVWKDAVKNGYNIF